MSKSFYVESIGCDVLITRKSGIKNMRLKVHPKNGVTVSLPAFMNYKSAIYFIEQKQNWINKKLKEAEGYKHNYVNNTINEGFKTQSRALKVYFDEHKKPSVKIDDTYIHIHFPQSLIIESVETQEFIRKELQKLLKLEAKQYIPQRVESLAKQHNLSFKDIRIGSATTRWGTCRFDNRLSFSCYLMLMNQPLIDYIILHELTHTIHKNHGKDFYTLLDRLCDGKHKQLNLELKKFKTPLTSKYNPE